MPDAFFLRWKLDRPCIEADKPEDVFALLTIEPNPTVLADAGSMPTHLLLLVDVSGSMDLLVRFDPNAQRIGQSLAEGRPAQKVFSDVPSRREIACAVVQKLAERLSAEDRLTLVAFDDKAHVLAKAISPGALDVLAPAISRLGQVGGGGTSIGHGLAAIRAILLETADATRAAKLVMFTDGEDQEPVQALAHAKGLAKEFGLPIVAFGTGECKVAFLTEMAKTTLAGAFNHIRAEADADQLFQQVLTGQKNVKATNVGLKLWLSPEVQVRELYRTRPEILYVGDLTPDASNNVHLRLEQMERGKAYEFLFRCTLPMRSGSQRLRIAKATLTFDLPGMGLADQALETNIVVEYAADPARVAERSGDVRRVLIRAEVQRQVLFLQGKVDALKNGTASDRDRVVIANLLQALTKKFDDFGDQAMANQYRAMEEEFRRQGTISQEMLNRSLAASSRAEDVIIAQDIDF
ncbi:MAG: VWA domain-containing protein [Planctomycetes bacterium]|nr:VWA domain-containing protein [Planctomycetota bacterium]